MIFNQIIEPEPDQFELFTKNQSLKKEIKRDGEPAQRKEMRENFTLKSDEEIKSFRYSAAEEPSQIPEENDNDTPRAAEMVQNSIVQPHESSVMNYLNKYQLVKPCSINRDRIRLALKPQNHIQTPPNAISFKHDFHNFIERNKSPPPE